jgi:hypothetical protein
MKKYHGIAIAKKNIGEMIKKCNAGIITAYLPEDKIFAVFFGDKKWCTFNDTEEWFLDNFEIIQGPTE